jgi:hypothetical protein
VIDQRRVAGAPSSRKRQVPPLTKCPKTSGMGVRNQSERVSENLRNPHNVEGWSYFAIKVLFLPERLTGCAEYVHGHRENSPSFAWI